MLLGQQLAKLELAFVRGEVPHVVEDPVLGRQRQGGRQNTDETFAGVDLLEVVVLKEILELLS